MGGPIGVRFVGFPKLQGGAETCLDWHLGTAGALAARDVPVLIRALTVRRLGVAEQARRTLAKLARRDLGPEPGPWLEWWAAERRARGLPEPRPPKLHPQSGAPPAPALKIQGWQLVLIQITVVAATIWLCAAMAPPMQFAVAACALALLVVLGVPRLLEVRRPRGGCRRERRQS